VLTISYLDSTPISTSIEGPRGLIYSTPEIARGEADSNEDRQITIEELSEYINENVSDMAGMLDREQTPGLQSIDKSKVLIRY